MDEKELESRIEQIIERKLDERNLGEEEAQKIKEEAEKDLSGQEEEGEGLSRRKFLKTIGAGAAGIGAMSLVPSVASKVTITDNGVKKDGSSYWYSGLGQNYDLSGNNLTDSGTTIYDTSTNTIPASRTHKTLPIVVPAVNLQSGETIQVARFTLPAGKQIKIWKAVVSQTDGTSDANLQLEVYNQTDAVSVYSTTNNTLQEGTPLASGGTGDEIEIRINNNDGSASFNAHATLIATIE